MATAQYETQERWPAAVLVATIAGFLCLTVWNSIIARPAGGYPIRIALPEAGAAAGGAAPVPGPAAEVEGDAGGEALQAIAPEEAGAPALSAAGASPGFSFDLTESGTQFDVADSGGSAIAIVKPVQLNGTEAGSANIRVSAGSSVSIEGSGLARLFERAGRGDLAGQIRGSRGSAGFIGFDELRRQGFAVRYDPRCDCVVISI